MQHGSISINDTNSSIHPLLHSESHIFSVTTLLLNTNSFHEQHTERKIEQNAF